ncbi:MAG: RNA degradosome polyphosphate kinase [Rhodospirillales bacterium]|nr:RNA degradosome polyphosphate kinase [Rhodospirillales bacterium]MYE20567.1 RNA degradosome polyphosphate kinase [Rhodospirillales bacterium]
MPAETAVAVQPVVVSRTRRPKTEQSPLPSIGLGPDRFVNRELSWIAFNRRVLGEASKSHHPLLERVNFLSISGTNLDEFYMVRVAALMGQISAGVNRRSPDGRTPAETLVEVNAAAAQLMAEQQACWRQLRAELAAADVHVIDPDELTASEHGWLSDHFGREIFPMLTPLAIDPAHPFPFIANLGFALVMSLRPRLAGARNLHALIPIPAVLPRFIRLPGSPLRFVMLEDVIRTFVDRIYNNCELLGYGTFRIIRDSEIELHEEAEDLVRSFQTLLRKRRRGNVVRLKINAQMPPDLRETVLQELRVDPANVVEADGIIGVAALAEIVECGRDDLRFESFEPRFPERIRSTGDDCFAAIRKKDLIVHHPYESFDVVVQFLRQAARDPEVLAIKQTLYRTPREDSPVVDALIEAAEAGKSVTALVELKARFNEEANIKLSRDMERAGVHVVYGFMGLKTHAKASLVIRQEPSGPISYVHFGTGNYHPATAKIYTDLSLFTCDPVIGRDAGALFNLLTGYAEPGTWQAIKVAPAHLRRTLLGLIEQEVAHARADRPASIWIKANALVDPEVIDALYGAGQAGVAIELVVRGVCCLRPGVPGLSDNIRAKSIVGRFLEHARIYCFGNGRKLPSRRAKVFISSADLMPRNLDRRCETMVPILNPTVHQQVLDQIMVANLNDRTQSWEMQGDGTYRPMQGDAKSESAHQYFMDNPSLSGRGKALRTGAPRSVPLGKSAN